jgi:Fe-S cluster assembly protein SufD
MKMNVQIESWDNLELELIPQHLAGHGVPWMSQARREAFARFAESGFPTRSEEDWKYTDVAAIGKLASLAPDNIPPDAPSEAALFA